MLSHTQKDGGACPPQLDLGWEPFFGADSPRGWTRVVSRCRGRTDNQEAFKLGLRENERGQLGAGWGETRVDRARFV